MSETPYEDFINEKMWNGESVEHNDRIVNVDVELTTLNHEIDAEVDEALSDDLDEVSVHLEPEEFEADEADAPGEGHREPLPGRLPEVLGLLELVYLEDRVNFTLTELHWQRWLVLLKFR